MVAHFCTIVTVKRGLATHLITSGGPRVRGFAASAAHLSDRQAVACHPHLPSEAIPSADSLCTARSTTQNALGR